MFVSDLKHADRALDSVKAAFESHGWTVPAGFRNMGTLTLDRPNGLQSVVQILASTSEGVTTVQLVAGVGHHAAAALQVALTLPASRTLLVRDGLHMRQHKGAGAFGQATIDEFVDEAVIAATTRADSFTGIDDLLEHLETTAASGERGDLTNAFLLAAATGQLDRAAALLTRLEASDDPRQRFLRQARRWIDAGGPPLPEQPSPSPESAEQTTGGRIHLWPLVIQAMREVDARRDAEIRLARRMRRNRTLSTDELRRGLAEDLAAHGVRKGPTTVALTVDRLQRRGGLLSAGRARLEAARVLVELATKVRAGIKTRQLPGELPAARAPERAAFDYRVARKAWTQLLLDPDGAAFLHDLAQANERGLSKISYLTVWLDGSGGAHVGERLVGSLDAAGAAAFRDVLASAAALDEDVRAAGFFADLDLPVLEIALPADDVSPGR